MSRRRYSVIFREDTKALLDANIANVLEGDFGIVGTVAPYAPYVWTGTKWADLAISAGASYQPLSANLTAISAIVSGTGVLKRNTDGSWVLDASAYLTSITKAQVEAVLTGVITSHTHNYQASSAELTAIAGLAGASGFIKKTAAGAYTLDTNTYQASSAELTAIAGLAGTTGFIKKTAAGAYTLDTNAYLTSISKAQVEAALGFSPYNGVTNPNGYLSAITKAQVEAVLTGAITSHTHSYQPLNTELTAIAGLAGASGFIKKTAAGAYVLDTNTYLTSISKSQVEAVLTGEITSHTHANTTVSSDSIIAALGYTPYNGATNPNGYLAAITKAQVEAVLTGAISSHTHSYQPLNSELTALAALGATAGFMKKLSAGVYTIDTNTYLTAITKAQVEAVLTGAITSHTHNYQAASADLAAIAALPGSGGLLKKTGSGTWAIDVSSYLTGNQLITLSGDVSGSNYQNIAATVNGLKGKVLPALTSGYLKYDGNAWAFDSATYLTAITKAQVEAVLTGAITTHTHGKAQITDFPSSMPASDVYAWAKAASKPSYTYSEVGAAASGHNHDGTYATAGHTHADPTLIQGTYTSNGGQQPPSYIGSGKVRFNMMNTTTNGDSSYKDWLLMDTYNGGDVPVVTAFGISKSTSLRAFIMQGSKAGASWDRIAELWHTGNLTNLNQLSNGPGYITSAGSCAYASNAGTVAGLSVASGRNNVANQIVRTDSNGYIQCGYINCSNGNEGNNYSPVRVWGTNGSDDYMRTYLTSALSVGYASGAGNADTVDGHHFNWSGQGGQPNWLWGGNDSSNMYVYNPSNFSVNYANSAGSVAWGNVSGKPSVYYQSTQPTGAVNGDIWIVI